jgi:malonyl-ACP decarboxylase
MTMTPDAKDAMGSDRFAAQPGRESRPFDLDSDGFILGVCSSAVVLEATSRIRRSEVKPYAQILGRALRMDANRNPDPSLEGEMAAIGGALEDAGVSADSIEYVNCHGTGSPRGDQTEVEAIRRSGLHRAHLNATKSITGHGLSAAGAVELVATLLQMRSGRLHVTRNLENRIDDHCQWVRGSPVSRPLSRALKLSMGFGGINAADCLERC